MPAIIEVRSRERLLDELVTDRGKYHVIGDTVVEFHASHAWCDSCKAFTLCEEPFLDPHVLQLVLEAIGDSGSKAAKQFATLAEAHVMFQVDFPSTDPLDLDDYSGKRKRKYQALLHQSIHRTLPPSCLTCGGPWVSFVPDQEWFPHPITGEDIRLDCTAMCSTDWVYTFYDIDGNRLPDDGEAYDRYVHAANQI